jgi:zinc protease
MQFRMLSFFVVIASCFGLIKPAFTQEKLISDRVFLVPDPKSNSIQFQMIVLAGSSDETNIEQFGIAHYLEHVVLVGRNAGHSDTGQKFFADGMSNGWTSQRATGYIHRFPASSADVSDRLDRLFRFYSERLKGFEILPEEAVRERNVVRQEHDLRFAGSPYSSVWIEASRFLYPQSNFGRAIIGTPESIAAFTVEEARNYLARWYRKSNVYFIVTGPISENLVKETAEKYLKSLDGASPPVREWLVRNQRLAPAKQEFRKSDKRIGTITASLQRIVSFESKDDLKTMATRMLITNFLSSKLEGSPHSALVEGDKPVASAISAASLEGALPGMISIALGSVPEEGRTAEEQTTAQKAYLQKLAADGISEATLERLKKRFARDYARWVEEPQNAPGRLINWLTMPLPYESLPELPKAVNSVSKSDIAVMLVAISKEGREAVVIFEPKAD